MSRADLSRVAYLDAPTPLPIAHRGGAKLPGNVGLENSLHAFRNAVSMGYTYLETDVHASRDDVVFAFHDEHLDRVTDRAGAIRDLPAADVRAARIDGREPVPELATLLQALPDARFNIDVKSDAAVEPTIAVVRSHDAVERVCLASFSGRRLRRVRALEPRIATSLGPAEVAMLRLAPVGWLRTTGRRRGGVCVQVPRTSHGVTVVTPGFVRRAHDCGLQVHVWTIDDGPAMSELLDLSVDGIVTDRPDVLRDVLRARGEWAAG
ncbi:MAG: glycerophosphodiester phosphodiesterase [Nocardioidaceae bacterium]